MASEFPGGGIGGGPEYNGGGRSIYGGAITGMNTANSDQPPSQHPYRAARLPGLFLDPIGNRTMLGLTGKRTLADFQAVQQFQNNPVGLSDVLLRSVKPRSFQNLPSPISPLTQIDLSAYNNNSNSMRNLNFLAGNASQQFGLPFLQQSRIHPQGIGFGSGNSYPNPVQNQGQKSPDMMHQLKELEKQLLDDDDEEENNAESGAVSAITNTNSEWSETIQNLVSPNLNPNQNPNLLLSSPTPSSSSSSSSTASPVSLCSRQTILEIATAISDGKNDVAAEIVARASQSLNLKGNDNNSSEQKLLKFMLSAFRYRIDLVQNAAPVSELYGVDHLSSTQLLCEVSPCFKLGFVAANLAILETMTADPAGENGFHVVDFDVGNGGQYVNLLEEISERKIRPTVKITAVTVNGGDGERLRAVGDMLNRVAERLGLSIRFDSVACSGLAELTRDSIGCDWDELLAVNFAYKLFRVPDESVCTENPRDVLLRRVKGLAPRVVTLVEQEINANTAPFTTRVNEAAGYYGALLDSVETTGLCGDSDRGKVEEGLSRKIANGVACEGLDRVERCEVFGKWRARMSMAGFESVPLSREVGESLRNRLGNGERVNPGFTVKEDNGGVCLGWLGRTLTVASTWR